MRRLSLTCVSALALVLLGALASGVVGKMIRGDSARAAAALTSLEPQASAPGWSRGQQNLAIGYDVCVRRMSAALSAEGYRRDDQPGGNFAAGIKDPHTAVIICGPAPEGRMLVQIVVASNGDGGGRERQCLQAQMEQPGASRCGGGGGNPGQGGACRGPDFFNTTFEQWDNGRSLGTINFYRDGTARASWFGSEAWRTDSNGDLLMYADGTRWVIRLRYDPNTCSFKGGRDRTSQTQDGVHTEIRPRM